MAVDWTGYKLAPDFSGLAQGLAQYGANKRQSAQFDAEMDYKNRALAADEAYKQQALLGGVNKFAPTVSYGQNLYKGNDNGIYRPVYMTDRNTMETTTSYINEITGQQVDPNDVPSLGLKMTTSGLAVGADQVKQIAAEEAAILAEQLKTKPKIEGAVTSAKEDVKIEKGGKAELEKQLGAENATYFSTLQDQAAQAIDEIPNLEATLAFSKDHNVVQGLGAKERAFVQKVFSDPTATQKYYTSLSRMATAVLNAQTGTKTENDALRAALDNAQATNTPEANQYLLELLVAQKKRDIVKGREANRLYNDGKFTKGNFLEQWGAQSAETQTAPTQGAQPNQAQLDYEAKKKALGL